MRTETQDCSGWVDDSIPFSYLLGNKYSGYYQALGSTGDVMVRSADCAIFFIRYKKYCQQEHQKYCRTAP